MNPELIRKQLGLPADATDEQVTARIAELTASEGAPEGDQPAEAPAETPEEQEAPAEEPAEAIAASRQLPEGMVAVPADVWASVQSGAAAGARVEARTAKERQESILASALKTGRIAPHQRDSFAKMFEKDPKGTEVLLTASVEDGGLMDGLVPIEARGSDPSVESMSTEAYPSHWLPEVAGRQAPSITLEG